MSNDNHAAPARNGGEMGEAASVEVAGALGVSPPSSGPGFPLQPQAASAAIPDAAGGVQSASELLPIAIAHLAEWCHAIDKNGTGWDDWDEHYKDAAYRPGPLRELIDAQLAELRERDKEDQ